MDDRLAGQIVTRDAALAAAKDQLRFFLRHSKAKNTIRAYLSNWSHFERWCDEHGLTSLPALPSTVALYISEQAGSHKTSTIRMRLAAITRLHEVAGHASPARDILVRSTWDGIRRTRGVIQVGKTPLLTDDIVTMASALTDSLQGIRDKALLLLGFAGCFRRSELIALHAEDLRFVPEGLIAFVRTSKTDQYGEGIKKGIPYGQTDACPVTAVRRWLDASGISRGPVFRAINRHGAIRDQALSGNAVALIIKRACEAAGLDPSDYAGHSLRSGLATQAAISGVTEASIVRQGAWKTERMARRYVRDGSLFRDNAGGQVGL